MDLEIWMKKNRWNASTLGEAMHVHPSLIRGIVTKFRQASRKTIEKIVDFTEGQVSVEELRISPPELCACPFCGKKCLPGRIEKGIKKQEALKEALKKADLLATA